MRKINTTITLDPKDKEDAIKLLDSFGMDLSSFVSIALKQMIYEQKIPFEITRNKPNLETRKALAEYKEMKSNKTKYKRYSSFDEILAEV